MENKKSRVLALYVHDMKLEIGHSNSLIELIRNAPSEFLSQFTAIKVVAFTSAPPEELFPGMEIEVSHTKVPFKGLKPVLLKAIFFQLWTWLYNSLFLPKGAYRIGVGISSLDVDAISIQFIHHQWTRQGLEMERGHVLRQVYKKFLFSYFELCEQILFQRRGVKFFTPAEFLSRYLKKQSSFMDVKTIYSGVNLARFQLSELTKEDVLKDLQVSYPQLSGIDLSQPIYLFVGAYERKGLDHALSLLEHRTGAQIIVVGSPSAGREVKWPRDLKIYRVPFSREIQKFYSLSDVFIFPTLYEPFGLVLFEAMAMGLQVITRGENVGASELMGKLPDVHLCDDKSFSFPEARVLSVQDRDQLRQQRLSQLGDVGWAKAGKELASYLAISPSSR